MYDLENLQSKLKSLTEDRNFFKIKKTVLKFVG
jgi:hypothetical protein